MIFEVKRSKHSVALRVRADDLRPLYGAAYLLTQAAYVTLNEIDGIPVVELRPKLKTLGVSKLARAFEEEYRAQVHRWKIADLPKKTFAQLSTNLPPAQAGLSPNQSDEIRRLMQEAESAPRDPLGIATPWSLLRGSSKK